MNFLHRTFAIVAVLLAAHRAGAGEVHPLATKAPASIELRDQYNSPQKLTFPATNITVLTIADRKGSEQMAGWVAALKASYAGRIRLRGIADVGGAPPFIHGKIRKKFQETRHYSVMMDWSGEVCEELSYQKDVANILVLGRDGAILGRFSGPANGLKIAEACALVDKALSDLSQVEPVGKSTSP